MCGIWAIINQKDEPFDYQTFCTLGCANDRRGGDSCGVFIDGNVEYGIGTKALFENFFWSSELLNTVENARIALGHDRKASVGGISLEKAHPIVVTETIEIEGKEPKEEVKFVLIHNGTIYNYEELAKKYIPDIDIKGMSDSQVIARLLYYSGYDWLAEYNGGAAFVAVDYRKDEPEIFIWRGESKKFSTATEMEEERPLFCNVDNGRLVVSSIASYLAICDGTCYTVPANEVLTYKDNSLWVVKKIDRSAAQQNKKYEYGTYGTQTTTGAYRGTISAVSRYLRTFDMSNTYKIGDENADGYVRMTQFGKVLTKYDTVGTGEDQVMVWFFNGIPLKEKKAYNFVYKAWKRSKLDLNQFMETYKNFIRYFSADQLYFDGAVMYKAIEPWKRQLYTGYQQMLTTAQCNSFLNGTRQYQNKVTTIRESFEVFKNVPQFDYKTIWKEFIQSMG